MIIRNSRYKDVLPDTIAYKGNKYTKAYAKGKLLFDSTDDDYEYQYFTIESLEDGNVVTFTIPADVTTSDYTSVSYSVDGAATWTTLTNDGSTAQSLSVTLDAGDKAIWKGIGNTTTHGRSESTSCKLTGTKEHIMYGNIASLLYGDNFYGQTSFPSSGYGFCCLFYGNTYVTDASNLALSFTNLRAYCYALMFRGCSRLVKAPKLPALIMQNRCYWQMFSSTAITEAPELNSTSLNYLCYGSMFNGCTSLVEAPELPATTLAQACYQYMFNGCRSLTEAPELPATTLTQECYQNMFYGCTNLNYIKCLATDISATNCTATWVQNVAATGTFVKADGMNDWTIDSVNGIPIGWTLHNYENCTVTLTVNDSSYGNTTGAGTYHTGDMVTIKANAADGYRFVGWYDGSTLVSQNEGYTFDIWTNVSYQAVFEVGQVDYSSQYFTIESLENNNDITFVANGTPPSVTLYYSTDNGATWSSHATSSSKLWVINSGEKILFKSEAQNYSTGNYGHYWSFTGTKKHNVYGNIMSLTYGDNFVGQYSLRPNTFHTFGHLFRGDTKLLNANNLVLPALVLMPWCYNNMFRGCTSLISAPILPATTLANYCYTGMFSGCTSLTTAPELHAMTLYQECYNAMFYGCTSLTVAPELPATTLAWGCYISMFYGCSNLTGDIALYATTLADHCYNDMFYRTNIERLSVYAVSSSWSIDFGEPATTVNPPVTGVYFVKRNATSNILDACPTGWTISKTLS